MSKSKQAESIAELILFSIYLLDSEKKENTFENIVKKCFDLFPENFNFKNNSQWPDSRKLDRPLRNLRKKGMIGGDPQKFFLTEKGKNSSLSIAKKFKQKKLF